MYFIFDKQFSFNIFISWWNIFKLLPKQAILLRVYIFYCGLQILQTVVQLHRRQQFYKKSCTHFRYKLLGTTAASCPIPCHYRMKNQLARFLRISSFHTIEQLVSSYITSASLNHKIFSTRKFRIKINNKVSSLPIYSSKIEVIEISYIFNFTGMGNTNVYMNAQFNF